MFHSGIIYRCFDQAIEIYERCNRINPKSAQTFLALGYSYHLKFDLMKALEYYHKAHFLKSEDLLIEELISKAMEDITNTELSPLNSTFFA